MKLEKYSIGVGDRFGRQGGAQLAALLKAKESGVCVVPVWNKSNREHQIIGTVPGDVRAEADAAVRESGWTDSYHVDADHIGTGNVDKFIAASDFFTLDVADYMGKPANEADIAAFVDKHGRYAGRLSVPGIERDLSITRDEIGTIARKVLLAVKEAGKLYRHIESAKGADNFVTEVSMDETDDPQTPVELFFILAAVADEGIPAQTIAPKFTGRFNKGVDYVGDTGRFTREFNEDLAVIDFAVREFGLPENLKLSVHSGSDKFSIYGPIGEAIRNRDAGLHLKTAGTTWLEELIGLAAAGGDGLAAAKAVYREALERYDEMCGPYAAVIDIDRGNLPAVDVVDCWSGEEYAAALRHVPSCPGFNRDLRQVLHVSYKVAAEMGERYLSLLCEFEEVIAANVTENIFDRHIARIFLVPTA